MYTYIEHCFWKQMLKRQDAHKVLQCGWWWHPSQVNRSFFVALNFGNHKYSIPSSSFAHIVQTSMSSITSLYINPHKTTTKVLKPILRKGLRGNIAPPKFQNPNLHFPYTTLSSLITSIRMNMHIHPNFSSISSWNKSILCTSIPILMVFLIINHLLDVLHFFTIL